MFYPANIRAKYRQLHAEVESALTEKIAARLAAVMLKHASVAAVVKPAQEAR